MNKLKLKLKKFFFWTYRRIFICNVWEHTY